MIDDERLSTAVFQKVDPPLGERIGRAVLIVLLAVAIAGVLLTAFPP
jgi:hypothetical protein